MKLKKLYVNFKRNKRARIISFVSFLAILLVIFYFSLVHNHKNKNTTTLLSTSIPYLQDSSEWAMEQINNMSYEEKAAQIVWIETSTKEEHIKEINQSLSIIKEYAVGGLLFTAGSPHNQRKFIREMNEYSNIPLFTAAYAEFGLHFVLDSIYQLPTYESLLCIQNDSTLKMIMSNNLNQLKACGINVCLQTPNISEIFDDNTKFYDAGFLHYKNTLVKIGLEYIQALQNEKIICACGPFPNFNSQRKKTDLDLFFDSLKLIPIRSFSDSGVGGITVSHKTLSDGNFLVYDSLQKVMNYQGLVISDLREHFTIEAVEKVLKNGSNTVIIPSKAESFPDIIDVITSVFTEEQLDTIVYRILAAKEWAKLSFDSTGVDSLYKNIYNKNDILAYRMVHSSINLLRNNNIIPITNTYSSRIASLSIGGNYTIFQTYLNKYSYVKHYYTELNINKKDIQQTVSNLIGNQYVIAAIYPKEEEIPANTLQLLDSLNKKTNLIICLFGESVHLKNLEEYPCIIFAHNEHPITQKITAQVVFGGMPIKASLFRSCSDQFCYRDGKTLKNSCRLGYTIPEDVAINGELLYKIDSIAKNSIKQKIFPGCQILVSRNGKVFYYKSFGYHTYKRKRKVKNSDVYDLASITKIASSTLALMKLYDQGKFEPDSTISEYLDGLENSQLRDVFCYEVLTHTSGLPPALPIGKYISKKILQQDILNIEKDSLFENNFIADSSANAQANYIADSLYSHFYSKERWDEYDVQIAENFYFRTELVDSIWEDVKKKTIVNPDKKYTYSDMNFYLVKLIVEAISGQDLDKYVSQNFYRTLNLKSIGYLPRKWINVRRIVPTEEEKFFRRQLIHGYVHDPTAAIMGGVGGHAGLFSNAHDLAVLMQMLLNGGSYGNIRYFSSKTVTRFTKRQKNSFRGLGFNRQTSGGNSIMASGASVSTFGHTGFTGTSVWADPETGTLFVFLSNRVYPKSANKKIIRYSVRQKMQQVVYDAMID
jgi:beta-N-acetylhexosaminidase